MGRTARAAGGIGATINILLTIGGALVVFVWGSIDLARLLGDGGEAAVPAVLTAVYAGFGAVLARAVVESAPAGVARARWSAAAILGFTLLAVIATSLQGISAPVWVWLSYGLVVSAPVAHDLIAVAIAGLSRDAGTSSSDVEDDASLASDGTASTEPVAAAMPVEHTPITAESVDRFADDLVADGEHDSVIPTWFREIDHALITGFDDAFLAELASSVPVPAAAPRRAGSTSGTVLGPLDDDFLDGSAARHDAPSSTAPQPVRARSHTNGDALPGPLPDALVGVDDDEPVVTGAVRTPTRETLTVAFR